MDKTKNCKNCCFYIDDKSGRLGSNGEPFCCKWYSKAYEDETIEPECFEPSHESCMWCKHFVDDDLWCKKLSAKASIDIFKPECFEPVCSKPNEVKKIKFVLNGSDISFLAEAPEDMTLNQLLKQCDRIDTSGWGECGICTCKRAGVSSKPTPAITFDYNDVKKNKEDLPCEIKEQFC